MSKKIVILYSGGLDSYMMYQYAMKTKPDYEIICVYYNHGHKAGKQEMKYLPAFVKIMNIDWLEENYKLYGENNLIIPGRNLAFVTLAACKFLPNEIWIGSLKGEDYELATDKNAKFKELANSTLNYVLSPYIQENIKIVAPFQEIGFDKSKLIQWAIDNGIELETLINDTKSCYSEFDQPCGECFQCLKRWALFGYYGKKENYIKQPNTTDFGKEFITTLLESKLGIKNKFKTEFVDYNETILSFILSHIQENENEYDSYIINLAKEIKNAK